MKNLIRGFMGEDFIADGAHGNHQKHMRASRNSLDDGFAQKALCRPAGADSLNLFLPMADAMGYVSGAATRLK
jgi:hypothetical protein